MEIPAWLVSFIVIADFAIRIGLSIRVIMRRRPVGVSLAWLVVILLVPFVGAAVYLVLGELRLGRRRTLALQALQEPYTEWLESLTSEFAVDWAACGPQSEGLAMLARRAAGIPALPGNKIELIERWDSAFEAMIADVEAARRTCHLEFYIWNAGGRADELGEALIRAARRGVVCRVLLDAAGSSRFLKSPMAVRFRAAGIRLESALAGGIFHLLVKRFDLRMHRKIVVIDGEIAYTGSLNLVDPRFFKKEANVGEWVDAMVRMQGPAVEPMAITFLADWALEGSESIDGLRETGGARRLEPKGEAVTQVLSTGPTLEGDAIQILLMTVYTAKRELIVTTPYFVPDESLLTALVCAARRGVAVTIVLPARVDSLLVRFASQPHMGELLANGVRVMLFDGGLLHTKSVTVDGELALFGSLNLDPRSIYLNFELTLAVYDHPFADRLRDLQLSYMTESREMRLSDWQSRKAPRRLLDNVARMLSPLL